MDDVTFDFPLLSFDEEFYLAENPDVAAAIESGAFDGTAEDHYVQFGDAEGRDPNQFFDVSFYFNTVPIAADFVDAGLVSTSLADYEIFGILEGRANVPSSLLVFDASFYLANNPDVLVAILTGQFGDPFRPEASAFAHFVFDGFDEGRLPNSSGSPRAPILAEQGVEVRIAGATVLVDNELLESFLSSRTDALADLNIRVGAEGIGDQPDILDALLDTIFFGTLFVPTDGSTGFPDGLF